MFRMPLNFIKIASSIRTNGREIFQKKRAYKGSSREPATGLAKALRRLDVYR
jgi:hypothetical protein